jgi:hypothetical protein
VRGHLRRDDGRATAVFASLDRGPRPGRGTSSAWRRPLPWPTWSPATGWRAASSASTRSRAAIRRARGSWSRGSARWAAPARSTWPAPAPASSGSRTASRCCSSPTGSTPPRWSAAAAREDKCSPPRSPLRPRRGGRAVLAGLEADIFVSAACSGTLDEPRLDRLAAQGGCAPSPAAPTSRSARPSSAPPACSALADRASP